MRIATVAVYYNIGASGILRFMCQPHNHLLEPKKRMSISFNIPTISELSTSHITAVIAITMVAVITKIVVIEFVSALKRFLSNKKKDKTDSPENMKYSKILREDIITLIVYSFWIWFIVKSDSPVSYLGVLGIVVLTILIIISLVIALFHYVRYQRVKEENSNKAN